MRQGITETNEDLDQGQQSKPTLIYPDPKAAPPIQMRFYLARSRRYNTPFDRAWTFAFRRVRWPHDTEHRIAWKEAIRWSRPAWRSAYENTPDHVEHIVTALQVAV